MGLGLGVLVGVWLIQLFDPLEGGPDLGLVIAVVVLAVVFGTIEGLAVGLLQHRVLSRPMRFLTARRWVGWRAFGAVLAWVAVIVPMTVMEGAAGGSELPIWVQVVGAVGIGLAAGPILGVPQAIAMKEFVAHPWRWVRANSLAWAVGMPLVFLAAGAAYEADLPWGAILAATALFTAGAVVGLIHGSVLKQMIDRHGLGLGSSTDALADIGSIDLVDGE